MKDLKMFIIGMLFVLLLVVLINGKYSTGGNGGAGNITCSSDGKIVYLTDAVNVFASYDSGKTWTIIKPDSKNGNLK